MTRFFIMTRFTLQFISCLLLIWLASGPCFGQSINYIRTWDATAPVTQESILVSKPLRDVKMTTQYIDGLGRPIQTVVKQGSLETNNAALDMVSINVYDEIGRESTKYLPFAANSAGGNNSLNDGLFKQGAIAQQSTFMNVQYGSQGEAFFYSKSDFEPSPLNRVIKSMAAGNSWVGAGVGVSMNYLSNTVTDGVRIWKVLNNSGGSGYTSPGVYGTGQLYKSITVDEGGGQVIEFKDKEGKVVLKKLQLTANPDNGAGSGHGGWLCTYYIYDDLSNLRCVIQPRGVELIATDWILSDPVILAEQCFRYEYDERNRMILKKVPGASEVYMVYDSRDRLVLTQDANMRGQGKWMYTQYDVKNRPIATGLWTNGGSLSFHRSQAAGSEIYPDLTGQSPEILSQTFYDNYDWVSGAGGLISGSYNGAYNSYFESPGPWPYPQSNVQTQQVLGMITGNRIKVLGTVSTYLYSVNIYDAKYRVIQVQTTNVTGGKDILTTQYTWSGQPLVTVQFQEKSGTNTISSNVVTKLSYDDLGRLTRTEKKMSNSEAAGGAMPEYRTLSENEYDKLGQLKKKKLAPAYKNNTGLETVIYDYNIRGWLLGANRAYLATTGQSGSTKFGFELGYDKTNNSSGNNFSSTQLNGNINGMLWKSDGDDVRRKYDFNYDPVNRLMGAQFLQDNSNNNWNNSTINYTVLMGNGSNIASAYDANGNIKAMTQFGWKLGASPATPIDNLSYNYLTNSNKLLNVIDASNVPLSKLGDFRTSLNHPVQNKNTTTEDYTYDANGNLKKDLNKDIGTSGIDGITYNHLNLPQTVTVQKDAQTVKGNITYTYDAAGNKLKKETQEIGAIVRLNSTDYTTNISTVQTYLAGFVYESKQYSNSNLGELSYNDKLQFTGHDEGRIRFKENKTTPSTLEYDYMLKDHLGNIRMLLTEEMRTDSYLPASMENGKESLESLYYNNISNTKEEKPGSYPVDPYTNPNNYAAKTKGDVQKIGPSITLRVMAGDKFNVYVTSYYNTGGNPLDPPLSILSSLAGNLVSNVGGISSTHNGITSSELENSGVMLSGASNFLNGVTYNSNKPKAFLNWILLDDQFNYISTNSYADQVGENGVLNPHVFNQVPITKNGYLYIYVSNETPFLNVLFDNLQVTHIRGPLLEETHYYPFGLKMFGISSRAVSFGGNENRIKFNGYELQSKEFSDGQGLEWYDYKNRFFDDQIGRFFCVDKLADEYLHYTPYQFAGNEVPNATDLDGLEPNRDPTRTEYNSTEKLSQTSAGQASATKLNNASISGEPNISPENSNVSPNHFTSKADADRNYVRIATGQIMEAFSTKQAAKELAGALTSPINNAATFIGGVIDGDVEQTMVGAGGLFKDAVSIGAGVGLGKILSAESGMGAMSISAKAEGLGNPFKGKNFNQIDKMFKSKGFEIKGKNPSYGKGSYINPKTGTKYYLDKGGNFKKGFESPHVDVYYNGHQNLMNARFFLDGTPKTYKPLE